MKPLEKNMAMSSPRAPSHTMNKKSAAEHQQAELQPTLYFSSRLSAAL